VTVFEKNVDGRVWQEAPDVPTHCGRAWRSARGAAAMRIAAVVVALASPITPPSLAQGPGPKAPAPRESLASIRARIEAEAAKVGRAEVSPLFTAIIGPAADPGLRLRDEQVQLCRKLEALARDVVRGWMLRGLDAAPPPQAGQLEARLADQGKKLREGVFAQAEAMGLEGILGPEQARAWYEKSHTKPRPRQSSRTGVRAYDPPAETETAETLSRGLRVTVGDLGRSGSVFALALGMSWVDQVHPEGFENLDPARRRELMKEKGMPQVVVSPEQAGLLRRLDGLTREIVAAWLVRGLDDQPPPSRASLARRRQIFPLIADALYTRADAIGLEAILAPEQAKRFLAVLWTGMGPSALLDPMLSSRLKLTRAQREEIQDLIASKYQAVKEFGMAGLSVSTKAHAHPELKDLLRAMDLEAQDRRMQADATIYSVLTPSQMRTMTRLLAPASDQQPGRQPPKK